MSVHHGQGDTWRPGDLVRGRYRVVQVLGLGATSAVYEALQLSTDRSVALKLFLGGGERAILRARDEACMLGRLTHSCAVRLYDHDTTEDGWPFLVLELVRGVSLSTALRRLGPFSLPDAIGLMAQVADGLAAVHRIGLVHGDIKPDNIHLVEGAGGIDVKLLDLGIAQWVDAERGSGSGTWAYMAPEQIEGAPATPAADVFACGVLLFEMLTGQRCFENSRDRFRIDRRPRVLRLPEPYLGSPVDDFIRWLTDPDPRARCPDGSSIGVGLSRLVDDRAPRRALRSGWEPPELPSVSNALLCAVRPHSKDRRVGRNLERDAILEHLAALRLRGTPCLLLFGGEAGIGKRALLGWAAQEARDALETPGGVFVDDGDPDWALRVLLAVPNTTIAPEGLLEVLERQCGGLSDGERKLVAAAVNGDPVAPERLARLVSRGVQRPTVLVFARVAVREGRLAFIHGLVDPLERSLVPLLIMATIDREYCHQPTAAKVLAKIVRSPVGRVHRVRRLAADEVLTLGLELMRDRGLMGEEFEASLSAALVRGSCGNPRALRELCAQLDAAGNLYCEDRVVACCDPLPAAPLLPRRLGMECLDALARRLDGQPGSEASERLILLARRCALLGRRVDAGLLRLFLKAEAAQGHGCIEPVLRALRPLSQRLVATDVLELSDDGWRFSQRSLWTVLDGANDGLPDGPRSHRLAARVKREWLDAHGGAKWQYREITDHERRADAQHAQLLPTWRTHDRCWPAPEG